MWKHLSTCLSPVNSGKVDHYANVDDLVERSVLSL
ncbi:unnamed protein product [Rhodiola kirilowii]